VRFLLKRIWGCPVCFLPGHFDMLFNPATERITTIMRIRNTDISFGFGIILLLVLFVFSTGCINSVQTVLSEKEADAGMGSPSGYENFPGMDLPADPSGSGALDRVPVTATPSPARTLVVKEVSPDPYVTSDPYRLPYRDHGTWSTVDIARIPRIPEYSKEFILRSNTTAIRVDVAEGPLVLDLTFSPLFDKPDQTADTGSSYPSEDADDEEEEDSGGASGGGTGLRTGPASFVYPYGEVTVIDIVTNATVAKEGYGCTYSSDKGKTMKVYKDGSFIVTLSGQFIDIKIKITTGSAPVVTTRVPVTYYVPVEEEW